MSPNRCTRTLAKGVLEKARGSSRIWLLLPVLLALALLTSGSATPDHVSRAASTREVVIEARRFGYEPSVIRVNRGERVRLVLKSLDVTHGLSLDAYDVSMLAMPGQEVQADFFADRQGKFVFRCNQVCGNLHPFMTGSLIVDPNRPLGAVFALAGLLSVGFLAYVGARRSPGPAALAPGNPGIPSAQARPVGPVLASGRQGIRLDLAGGRVVRWLLGRRAFQFALFLPALFVVALVLIAGFAGSPVGDHNLAIVLVWSVWWPFLVFVLIPVGGRAWCAACPVPAPGEWLQRLALVRRRGGKPFTLGWSWPRRLRNMWPQSLLFLAVAGFSAVVLTSPVATAIALAAFVGLSMFIALLFRGRSFCRYVCPLGGFIGLYSLAAPLALRVKSREVCRAHEVKSCIEGNGCGYGCPWFEYPGTMERSVDCGLCMECLKTCPRENIAVGLQAPGHDLVRSKGRSDEAYRAVIALSVGLFYTAVMLGPWGVLKGWAGNPATVRYLLYVGLLAGTSLLVVPSLLLGAARLFKWLSGAGELTTGQVWTSLSYSLVPLGLLVWMVFAATAFSVGAAHLPAVVSDPLGRGWDLFGTAGVKRPPLFSGSLPYLQAGGLLVGLAWSLAVSWRRVERLLPHRGWRTWLGLVPMVGFLFGITATFLWLFLG